jgi:hypothetical protein
MDRIKVLSAIVSSAFSETFLASLPIVRILTQLDAWRMASDAWCRDDSQLPALAKIDESVLDYSE